MARRLLFIALVALLVPSLLTAQRPQTRQGFWFNGGLGWGSAGCDGCGRRLIAARHVEPRQRRFR